MTRPIRLAHRITLVRALSTVMPGIIWSELTGGILTLRADKSIITDKRGSSFSAILI